MTRKKREPGDQWRCEACGEPLIAALTNFGRVAPIVIEADDERGDQVLFRIPPKREGAGTYRAAVITDKALLKELRLCGVPLHLNHFADCPHADQFRRSAGSIGAKLDGEAPIGAT